MIGVGRKDAGWILTLYWCVCFTLLTQRPCLFVLCSCLFVFHSTRTDWLSGLTCTDQNFCQKAGGQAFAKAEEEGIALYVSYGYLVRHSLACSVAA
jgi:hypothetical protein